MLMDLLIESSEVKLYKSFYLILILVINLIYSLFRILGFMLRRSFLLTLVYILMFIMLILSSFVIEGY